MFEHRLQTQHKQIPRPAGDHMLLLPENKRRNDTKEIPKMSRLCNMTVSSRASDSDTQSCDSLVHNPPHPVDATLPDTQLVDHDANLISLEELELPNVLRSTSFCETGWTKVMGTKNGKDAKASCISLQHHHLKPCKSYSGKRVINVTNKSFEFMSASTMRQV